MSRDLDPARIEQAATVIDPVFLRTPQYVDDQLTAVVGRPVLTKIETTNPLRSFKGRGTDFLLATTPADAVVCASSGNFGQGLAYAGRRHGVAVTVYTSRHVNPVKVARMRAFGATVVLVDAEGDGDGDIKEQARGHRDAFFVDDGHEPAVAEGAGTIGLELLSNDLPDVIVLPVGDGALLSGVATWIRAVAPGVRVVGVCPSGAPSMYHSFHSGGVVTGDPVDTIAEGIATRVPVGTAVRRVRILADDLVLVDDADLRETMRTVAHTLGLFVEPAGAAGLAAIRRHGLGERPATVITGANPHPDLVRDLFVTQ